MGKQSGRQYINLDTECVKSLAQVLHQMTHALGFYHMHTRADRDKYISVHPENALARRFDTRNATTISYEHVLKCLNCSKM